MKKIIEKCKNCKQNFIIYIILFIVIILFLIFRSLNAFEYTTNSADVSSVYMLTNHEVLTQNLNINSGILTGVNVMMGTYQRINKGVVSISLNENGIPIRCSSIESQYITDNTFHKFYFNQPIQLKNNKQYSLSISCEYDGENNAVATYVSTNGDLESSVVGITDYTLVYQLLLVNNQIRRNVVVAFIALFVCLFLIFLYKTDISKSNVGKNLIRITFMIICIETICTDLMPNITRNVSISPQYISDTQILLLPGNFYESSFDTNFTSLTD